MVEEDRAHVVQMPIESEQTSPCLIRPHLDLVIIPSRHEQGLCLVEVNPSDRSIMLFEAVYKCSHTVVP